MLCLLIHIFSYYWVWEILIFDKTSFFQVTQITDNCTSVLRLLSGPIHTHIYNYHPNFILPNAQYEDESSFLMHMPLTITSKFQPKPTDREEQRMCLLCNCIALRQPILTSVSILCLDWSEYNSFQVASLVSYLLNVAWPQ